jgi:hypothetical protein
LTVLVEKKVAKAQLAKDSVVPTKIDGFETDVVETGPIDALQFTAKVRPALPGYSIGHYNITAGTFGCLVRDLRAADGDSDCLVLSNNHVLAASNAGKVGDLILQPGPFDGGVFPSDAIAKLERFETITFGMSGYNLVDAAVARPLYSREVTASIIGLVMPTGVGQALPGMFVVKIGRTTMVTVGHVLSVNATVAVGYGIGVAIYRHQIMTTGMSAGGDSGSLLMDERLNAVGLLFAGSPYVTIFNHVGDVESVLGVRPLTAPRFA